ncbi:MAG: HNH endonuclease [Mesorhizobium sp.]|nr:MAG: HNH endonuclease [Mesorhizobium sp.]
MSNGSRRPQLRAILREKQGGRCCYCLTKLRVSFGNRMQPDSETIEHLNRREEGGGNERDNIALACHACNTGRGDVDWLTYTTIRRGEHYEKW